jgi:hypothetical protein
MGTLHLINADGTDQRVMQSSYSSRYAGMVTRLKWSSP